MQSAIDATQLKLMLKEAVVEVLEEHRDLLREIMEDAMEDIAMIRAIDDGMKSGDSSREEVFQTLTTA
jgi:hypothetical protein